MVRGVITEHEPWDGIDCQIHSRVQNTLLSVTIRDVWACIFGSVDTLWLT